MPGYDEGAWWVQDLAAQLPARLLGTGEGKRALDLCAAPGGKTVAIARSGAHVVACDVDERRLERVRENLLRTGLAEQVELLVSDGATAVAERTFDAVLVDAPCSNTGVLAARPEARWRFSPSEHRSLAELQARLLRAAADRVRAGGRLIWSTCSLEPRENAAQVRALLAERSDFTLERSHELLPDPTEARVDGGFAARLVRSTAG
jgi:16S rRNA (cytosine967-C5)-methyltransferase